MNAVLKEVKARRANVYLPKGPDRSARNASKTRVKAKTYVPKSDTGGLPLPAPIAVAALGVAPKGRIISATQQPNEDRVAIRHMPTGQSVTAADLHQLDAGSAITAKLAGQTTSADPASIQTLRELHRKRQDFHRAEKSLTLQSKATCRRLCGGDKTEAEKLYNAAVGDADDPAAIMARDWIAPFLTARSELALARKTVEKQMDKTAKGLPIVPWVDGVKGFGIASLAALIGEAGDLSNYPTHSHLWKRLGLAVIGGERQRRVAGADAILHGYCPSRRSVVWNIGQCVFKAQSQRVDKETGEIKAEAGPYRKIYDARKEYELPRVESKAHAHNRATRYMEKKLIRDLWKAWRGL